MPTCKLSLRWAVVGLDASTSKGPLCSLILLRLPIDLDPLLVPVARPAKHPEHGQALAPVDLTAVIGRGLGRRSRSAGLGLLLAKLLDGIGVLEDRLLRHDCFKCR